MESDCVYMDEHNTCIICFDGTISSLILRIRRPFVLASIVTLLSSHEPSSKVLKTSDHASKTNRWHGNSHPTPVVASKSDDRSIQSVPTRRSAKPTCLPARLGVFCFLDSVLAMREKNPVVRLAARSSSARPVRLNTISNGVSISFAENGFAPEGIEV